MPIVTNKMEVKGMHVLKVYHSSGAELLHLTVNNNVESGLTFQFYNPYVSLIVNFSRKPFLF